MINFSVSIIVDVFDKIFVFIAERRKNLKGVDHDEGIEAGEIEDSDDYMDDVMKAIDQEAFSRIQQIIGEHLADIEITPNNSSGECTNPKHGILTTNQTTVA